MGYGDLWGFIFTWSIYNKSMLGFMGKGRQLVEFNVTTLNADYFLSDNFACERRQIVSILITDLEISCSTLSNGILYLSVGPIFPEIAYVPNKAKYILLISCTVNYFSIRSRGCAFAGVRGKG